MKLVKTKSFELAVNEYGDPKSGKMVLLMPGRLDTKDYANFPAHGEFLAKKGYFCVAFDPPGSWDSPGGMEIYTVPNYLKAVNELIEFYGNRPTVLLSHSRGGSVAMVGGVVNEHVSHIISIFSAYGRSKVDHVDGTAEGYTINYRDLPPGTERTKEKKRFDLPLTFFDDPTPYTGLETCTKPKLFFAGLKDTINPPGVVRKVYALAAEPKKLVELDSEHDYRLHPEIIEQVNQAVAAFLA